MTRTHSTSQDQLRMQLSAVFEALPLAAKLRILQAIVAELEHGGQKKAADELKGWEPYLDREINRVSDLHKLLVDTPKKVLEPLGELLQPLSHLTVERMGPELKLQLLQQLRAEFERINEPELALRAIVIELAERRALIDQLVSEGGE